MDVSHFLAINLIIDVLLMIGLSYYIPRHAPLTFLCLVLLNLSQYVVHVPLERIPGLKNEPEPGRDVVRALELLGAARENFERAGLAVEGAAEGMALPPPEVRWPNFKELLDPRSPSRQLIDEIASGQEETEVKKGGNDSVALYHDPHALWLFTRIFWLVAAGVLMLQRPSLGLSVVSFQLIPVPFLSFALPYLYFWAQDLRWVRAVQGALENPAQADEFISPEGLGVTLLLFAGLFLVMMCGTLAVLARRASPDALLHRKYMNPEKYRVKINGNLLPFTVDGHYIEVEGVRMNCREVAVFPGRPNVWQLNSSTVLEFVER